MVIPGVGLEAAKVGHQGGLGHQQGLHDNRGKVLESQLSRVVAVVVLQVMLELGQVPGPVGNLGGGRSQASDEGGC